jgi:protein-tyrosine phosphatase
MVNPDKINEFADAGCWLQITAGSLVGRFGRQAQQAAFKILDAGWNCLLATDAHNLQDRPPLLSEGRAALLERYGEKVANDMVFKKPAQILGLETT